MRESMRASGNRAAWIGLAIAGLLLGGCSKTQDVIKEEFQLSLALDREFYRPGEAIMATLAVTNLTGETQEIRSLNFDSVEFYFDHAGGERPRRISCVFSPKEWMLRYRMVALAPGQSTQPRRFVLTKISDKSGEFALTAAYNPDVNLPLIDETSKTKSEALKMRSKAWADPGVYQVVGDRKFNRDKEGVLLESDAVSLCVADLGRQVMGVDTDLIRDEAGFLMWWVCLTLSPENTAPGEAPKKAWFVNPYLAKIAKAAPIQLTYYEQRPGEQMQLRPRRQGAGQDRLNPPPGREIFQ